jgi:hypothetical protein
MSDYDNGFARAQRDYDNQSPPEDDRPDCPACEGSGEHPYNHVCNVCDGTGYMSDEQIEQKRDSIAERRAEAQAEAELERKDEYKEWCGGDSTKS